MVTGHTPLANSPLPLRYKQEPTINIATCTIETRKIVIFEKNWRGEYLSMKHVAQKAYSNMN